MNIFPDSEINKMFARIGEAEMDTSGVRRKFLNCPYGEDKRQTLDIYLPNEGSGPFPAVFFLHGGGWVSGSRSDKQAAPFMHGLERGYAIVAVGYRLAPAVRYPDNLYDVKNALRWVSENAETYLIDRGRFVLAGASAGAHLALMAAFTYGISAFEGTSAKPPYTIRAVIDQFGPTDFFSSDRQFEESDYPRARPPRPERGDASDMMFGIRKDDAPNLVRFMNPVDNVHPGVPPVLLLHGRHDPIVPYQQSVELYERIVAAAGAGSAELDVSEEFLHADPRYAEPDGVERIFSFIEKHIGHV
ncbi:MAG: alpha/beta hydrolase [Oscillospiraceae bacterium]|jgi:acetyl esterase/lipase|nr:alpha/beta hydrolase [Oscillospiraceae bacterium]